MPRKSSLLSLLAVLLLVSTASAAFKPYTRAAHSFNAASSSAEAGERRQLTPILRAGGDVPSASKVGPLPGITAASFAGYFEVDAAAHAELFFWYFPALNGNESAPVIVWLQGGPGSSSLFGLFAEHGPYRIDREQRPHPNAFSWANEFGVVYVDNPRGTGYSVADAGTLCTRWECYANDFDAWLRQFVAAYGLAANDVYITGESYAGHYVPASAFIVAQNNRAGVQPFVRLAGVAIGNGFVAPREMSSGYADEIFEAGLISLADYGVAQSYVANITAAIDAGDYVGAYLVWDQFLNGDAHPGGAWFANVTGGVNYYNIATDMSPALDWYTAYVTSAAVRAAIGVGAQQPYADGNPLVEQALQGDVMFSQKMNLEALLQQGYKVLVYNGALDLICGAPLTERYMNVLQWVGSAQWLATPRSPWLDADGSGAVSGYSRSAQNLAQVVMRGAGHLAPFDQPRRSLDLITRFVSGRGYFKA